MAIVEGTEFPSDGPMDGQAPVWVNAVNTAGDVSRSGWVPQPVEPVVYSPPPQSGPSVSPAVTVAQQPTVVSQSVEVPVEDPPVSPAVPSVPAQPARRAVADLVQDLDRQPEVAARGLRKLLHLAPSRAEIDLAEDLKLLRAKFPRPVSVVVANVKGGTGKTPTAVGLGAAFGLERGGSVVMWDNNELRGTAGLQTFRSHQNTVRDLLAYKDWLLGPNARVADVQAFLNWQPTGHFWVLNSAQAGGQVVTGEDFQTVWTILSRFFELIIVDTGNAEGAQNWREAVHNADAAVIPMKWRKSHFLTAAGMIEDLEKEGRAVVRKIIVVGSDLEPLNKELRLEYDKMKAEAVAWFGTYPMVEIPSEIQIAKDAELDWDRYAPATQRAYQSLGATVSQVVSRNLGSGLNMGSV